MTEAEVNMLKGRLMLDGMAYSTVLREAARVCRCVAGVLEETRPSATSTIYQLREAADDVEEFLSIDKYTVTEVDQ